MSLLSRWREWRESRQAANNRSPWALGKGDRLSVYLENDRIRRQRRRLP